MILLASISEIFRFDTSSTSRTISFSISFAILISWITFAWFASFKWYQSNIPEKLESMKYTKKFFENTKNSKAAHFNIIRVLSKILCLWIVANMTIKSINYVRIMGKLSFEQKQFSSEIFWSSANTCTTL